MAPPPAKRKRSMNSLLEFVLIVAVALGLALAIQAWLVKPFRIPSGSMEPTLAINQRVLVDRVTGHFSDPGRGDIVGNVLSSKFRFEKAEAVEFGDAGTVRYPYRKLYAYDHGRRALQKLDGATLKYPAD